MRVAVIINQSGGTAKAADDAALIARIEQAFGDRGVEAAIRTPPSDGLNAALEAAAADTAFDAIVAGGGDGTIACAAGVAVKAGATLGILPLGTLNHFAHDAGIPDDIEAAVAVIAAGTVRRVDVATLNGRVFVNNSAVGLYPFMVDDREAQEKELGRSKRLAMVVASLRALRHFKRHRLTVRVGGRAHQIQTPLLFIGNNDYETALPSLGRRGRIDGASLSLYALLARTRRQLLGLALRGLIRPLGRQRDFLKVVGVTEARIESRSAVLSVSTDGETRRTGTPLCYRILPGALRLIVPA